MFTGHWVLGTIYSYRNASIGSSFAARIAGTIPLTTPTTDSVTVSYTVNAVNGTTGLPTRLADHGIAHIKVPATGTTTTYTLSTVI